MERKRIGPNIDLDTKEHWKRIAAQELGVPPWRLLFVFRALGIEGRVTAGFSAAGGATAAASRRYRATTGGGAGGVAGAAFSGGLTSGAPADILTLDTENWWMAGQFSIDTAVGAGAHVGMGARSTTAADGTKTLVVGGEASVSTTNFALYGSAGTSIDSAMALDTDEHVHHVLHRDSVTSWWIQHPTTLAIQAALTGDTRPGADSQSLIYHVFNSNAVEVQMSMAWAAVAVPI